MHKVNPGRRLSPCPFCGGGAEVNIGDGAYRSVLARVECSKCHAATKPFIVGTDVFTKEYDGVTQVINKAINDWEKRDAPETDQSSGDAENNT